jgi:hypothetical protein
MILYIASRQPLNAHPRCYSEVGDSGCHRQWLGATGKQTVP